jgi:hypothetical protein
MNLELSNDEVTILRSLLEQSYRDLKEEVYKTEAHDLKEQLVAQERIMLNLLHRLGVDLASPAPLPGTAPLPRSTEAA